MRDSIKPAIRMFCVMLTITGLSTATFLLPFRASQAASLKRAGSLVAAKHSATNTAIATREAAVATSEAQAREAYGNVGVYFEANRGQVDSRADFIARGAGYSLFLTPTEAVYVLTEQPASAGEAEMGRWGDRVVQESSGRQAELVTKHAVRMKIEGANAATNAAGLEELPGKVNYLIGNEPSQWHTDIPTYSRVQYSNIYHGVDLVYYGNGHQLEYDLVVAPGSDARQIALKFDGADRVEVDGAGDLSIQAGKNVLRQGRPSIYQEVNGARREVQSGFVMKGGGRVGFSVGAYDASRPLVIDPVLAYSTYLGGAGSDLGNGIAVNAAGSAYVTGQTDSDLFPTTSGSFQTAKGVGQCVFVTKMNPEGSALAYSTYLGGSNDDVGLGIAVDAAGNAYVTGFTVSIDFPGTGSSTIQSTYGGGGADAFVTKLNAAGSALLYSTYLGGSNDDLGLGEFGFGIAVDATGNAYVTGRTTSTNFPGTGSSTIQSTNGGGQDAFVTKVNAPGSALVYSTYLGGNNTDFGRGIAVGAAGNAYVTGDTASSTFPVTDSFQTNINGFQNGFVSKIGNYSISGRVIDQVGNPLGNVQMALSGPKSKVTYTDLQGYFIFENATTGTGANYNVVPARSGLAFTPTIQNISNFSRNVELIFTGFSGTPTGGGGGLLGFVSHSFSVNKTDGTAAIIVQRLGGDNSAEPVTIDYFTSDGTASERSDYIAASGTLEFGLNEVTKTFNVLINNNGYVEGTRTVNLILENPTNGARLSNQTAVLEIHDTNTAEPPVNPSDDAQFFVRQQYYDFLDRTPDADGLAYWANQISACGADHTCVNRKRREVSAAFFVEREFQQSGYFVYLMHKSSFAEQPGYPRFSRDRARVTGGSGLESSKTAFAEQWVARQDFLTRYPLVMTDDNYVDALNLNAGAVLTATERGALINGLGNGTETRATVLRKITDTPLFRQNEYNAAFVLMQYFGYLHREVDHSGYAFWLDVLNNRTPGNFQGMVCAFVTSEEYQDRFGSIHSHSNAECGQ